MKKLLSFSSKPLFLIFIFLSFSGKAQLNLTGHVNFKIGKYSYIPHTSLTYTIQVQGDSGLVPIYIPDTLSLITSNVSKITGLISITYAGCVSTNTSSFSATTGVLTFSDSSISNMCAIQVVDSQWWDYATITMSHTGDSTDVTDIIFSSISGLNVGTMTGLYNEPLPVKLISFTVKGEESDAQLNWSTATEKSNDHFEVERSFDGLNFVKIGQVKGNGNTTNIVNYNFVDKNISETGNKVLYYRLKQIDFDGNFEYSNIQPITLKPTEVKIFPNPVTDILKIETTSKEEILIFNSLGQKVWVGLSHDVNVSNLPSGFYFLKMGEETKQFVKN